MAHSFVVLPSRDGVGVGWRRDLIGVCDNYLGGGWWALIESGRQAVTAHAPARQAGMAAVGPFALI